MNEEILDQGDMFANDETDFDEKPLEAYDTQIDETDLAAAAARNTPQVTDDHFPRFGMSGLLPIPLYRQHGNNSYGDFNPKDARGINKVNYNWFPPFALVPFFGGTFDIPYENKMTVSEEPIAAAPFDYDAFLKQPRDGYSKLTRNPKECGDVFLRETSGSVTHVFKCLVGYRVTDPDKGLDAARKLVNLILPVRDRDIFPEEIRERSGVPFKGPFLDRLIDFVKTTGLTNITKNRSLTPDERTMGMELHKEIFGLLRRGASRANTMLNETEAEMRDPAGIQKTYGPPDLEVPDAPVPTDLYCLAHTNRIELDDKQLHASKNIGESIADPMTKAVEQLTDVVQRMGQTPASVPLPADVMTMSQVEEVLERQRLAFEKTIEDRVQAAVAGATNSGGDPAAVGSTGEPPAQEPDKPKGRGGRKPADKPEETAE